MFLLATIYTLPLFFCLKKLQIRELDELMS